MEFSRDLKQLQRTFWCGDGVYKRGALCDKNNYKCLTKLTNKDTNSSFISTTPTWPLTMTYRWRQWLKFKLVNRDARVWRWYSAVVFFFFKQRRVKLSLKNTIWWWFGLYSRLTDWKHVWWKTTALFFFTFVMSWGSGTTNIPGGGSL